MFLMNCFRVWALRCDAGNDGSSFEHNSIYSLFSVSLLLTDEGYQNINEVQTVFRLAQRFSNSGARHIY